MKQRLVGAVVLVIAAVVFVPMLLDSEDEAPDARGHTLVSPAPPETGTRSATEPADATARVLPLGGDSPAPATSSERASSEAADRAANGMAGRAPDAPSRAAAEPPESGSAEQASAKKSGFAVQLGSFSQAGNARGLRDRLVAKGYPAYMVTSDSVTRVYVGPQPSRAEAERVREKLLAETKLKGIVVEHAG